MAQFISENGTFCLNLTVEKSPEVIYTDVDFIPILVLNSVICILGFLLNSSYLFVLYRVRDMRTTTNVYLGHLAVADSSFLLVKLVHNVEIYFYTPVNIYGPCVSRYRG